VSLDKSASKRFIVVAEQQTGADGFSQTAICKFFFTFWGQAKLTLPNHAQSKGKPKRAAAWQTDFTRFLVDQ